MADVMKMDYGLMKDMSRTCLQAVEQLQDTTQEMQNVANMMEDGALLGAAGDAFVEALRNTLTSQIARLSDKFDEVSQDLMTAMSAMQEADTTAAKEMG